MILDWLELIVSVGLELTINLTQPSKLQPYTKWTKMKLNFVSTSHIGYDWEMLQISFLSRTFYKLVGKCSRYPSNLGHSSSLQSSCVFFNFQQLLLLNEINVFLLIFVYNLEFLDTKEERPPSSLSSSLNIKIFSLNLSYQVKTQLSWTSIQS